MVQAIINIENHTNRILNIIKAKFDLKDKSEAINVMAKQYEEDILELQLKPQYVKKLHKIKKDKGVKFGSISELRKHIEDA